MGDQVRVRVRAAGLNRADLMQAGGSYPAPPGVPADIPGLEFAGEVDALGPDVTGPLKVGDRVFGIVGGRRTGRVRRQPRADGRADPREPRLRAGGGRPRGLPDGPRRAGDPRAASKPGERVLIHAVGGGVGSAAVQIAHAMGCIVLGTSRTAEKLEQAPSWGSTSGSHSNAEDFAGRRPRDDGRQGRRRRDRLTWGRPPWRATSTALARAAGSSWSACSGGGSATIDLTTLLRKRITIVGTTLRARPLEEKIAVTRRFAERVVPWLERGLVRPVVDRVFALDDVRAAQKRLESNLGFGKVILRL